MWNSYFHAKSLVLLLIVNSLQFRSQVCSMSVLWQGNPLYDYSSGRQPSQTHKAYPKLLRMKYESLSVWILHFQQFSGHWIQPSFISTGSWKEFTVHWLRPEYTHWKNLRWSPQVYPEDNLRSAGTALPLAAQQRPGCCQRVLFLQRAPGGASARSHEWKDRHRQARQDHIAHVCRWEGLELHLPRKSRCCPFTFWHSLQRDRTTLLCCFILSSIYNKFTLKLPKNIIYAVTYYKSC